MPSLKKRLAVAALTVSAALLLLPAACQAAQAFGTNLQLEDMDPDEAGCEIPGPCTIAGFAEKRAEGLLSSAGSPIDGVITKFRIKPLVETAPVQVTFRVANVNQVQDGEGGKSAKAVATGTGPTVTLPVTPAGQELILQFPAQVSVAVGQHLALDAPSDVLVVSSDNGRRNSYEFAPPLVDGSGERTSNNFLGFLLVEATVEPDVDKDGFGDETQDGCPSQKATQGGCDLTKPTIKGFHVRKGKITYKLSETAKVSLKLARKNGRKFKSVGKAFKGPGKAGANKRGLPHAGNLKPGTYRLKLTATDEAGNKATKAVVFPIKG